MKYKNIIKLRLPEIQLLAVVPTQLKFSVVKDHDKPTILLSETLFCMWECFNMGTELPTKVMLGQTLILMQETFVNNVRKEGRLGISRTSCLNYNYIYNYNCKMFSKYLAPNKKFWKELICLLSLHYLKMSLALKSAFAPT
jgi:hypothetical protein